MNGLLEPNGDNGGDRQENLCDMTMNNILPFLASLLYNPYQ
ncbi:hypothetical protein MARINOS108_11653 [Marinoscillum sp. 108]|nr:hypothetical protein MARINOS108_11653 [Marinoscillum sp. 108]